MLALEALLPGLALWVLALSVIGVYRKIKKIQDPEGIVIGALLNYFDIIRFQDTIDDIQRDQGDDLPWRAKRRVRRNYFRINYAHFCSSMANIVRFHGLLSCEKARVDERKSTLDYSPREALIVATMKLAARLRWQQTRSKMVLQFRGWLGLRIDDKLLEAAILGYKALEREVVAIADMNDSWYATLLRERLGLLELRLVDSEDDSGPHLA